MSTFVKIAPLCCLIAALAALAAAAEPDQPCMTIQSVSEVRWCADTVTQSYFSVISDGCHIYVKYDGCDGVYREWWFNVVSGARMKTGHKKLDFVLGQVADELVAMRKQPRRTDEDVHNFLNRAIQISAREKLLGSDPKGKGTIKFNTATRLEIMEFTRKVKNPSDSGK